MIDAKDQDRTHTLSRLTTRRITPSQQIKTNKTTDGGDFSSNRWPFTMTSMPSIAGYEHLLQLFLSECHIDQNYKGVGNRIWNFVLEM